MDAFRALLDASINHLKALKDQGVQYVQVEEALLRQLIAPGLQSPPRQSTPSQSSLKRTPPSPPPVNRSTTNTPAPQAVPVPPPFIPSEPSQANPLPIPTHSRTKLPPPPSRRNLPPPSVSPAQKPDSTPAPEALSAFLPLSNPTPEQRLKDLEMAALKERALVCQKCPHLVTSRTQVVFGVGNVHSPLMFVGEAPGMDEDRQGEPFVGKAGQLLTKIIQTMGLTRDGVYIGNVLKCRPDTPNQSYGNRPPTPEEMEICLPFLMAQIDLIQPKILVALGGTAIAGLMGRPQPITKIRGQWMTYRHIPLMPTFHPSYLLRNSGNDTKRLLWEDMLQVMERLQLPISDKQRRFFL